MAKYLYFWNENEKQFKSLNIGKNFSYYQSDFYENLCMYSNSPCTSYPVSKK